MKKLTTLILFLLIAQVSLGQIDNVTKNKIKVMYLSAENYYKSNEYTKTLNEINKIESLSKGLKLATAQNLKVKSLIGLNRFKEAQKELEVLYNLNPNSDILTDIAQYSSKIDEGINKAREAEQKELKRIQKEREQKEEFRKWKESIQFKMTKSEIGSEMLKILPLSYYGYGASKYNKGSKLKIEQNLKLEEPYILKSALQIRSIGKTSYHKDSKYKFIYAIDLTEVDKTRFHNHYSGVYVVTIVAKETVNDSMNSKKITQTYSRSKKSKNYTYDDKHTNWSFSRSDEFTYYTTDLVGFVFENKEDALKFQALANALIHLCN
tara:strand:- start:204 stop:1169 length:966 start_codon:yes stop_codon:yes gene_type:complete